MTRSHPLSPNQKRGIIWVVKVVLALALVVPVAVAISMAPTFESVVAAKDASYSSYAASAESYRSSHPVPPPAQTTTRATQAASPTRAASADHAVIITFGGDAGSQIHIIYSCGRWNRNFCTVASGTTISVVGETSKPGVGLYCRIEVDGQTVVSRRGSTDVRGGNLACATVVQ